MKKIYRPGILATAICLMLSLQGISQDETPAPPSPPSKGEAESLPPATPEDDLAIPPVPPLPPAMIQDGNGVIIRQKGKKSAKITVELNGGDVRVNGKPISEFRDKNVSVDRLQPGEITITTDDGEASLFRDKAMNLKELNNMRSDLERQQRQIEVNVNRSMQQRNMVQDRENRKLQLAMTNEAYLGVASKRSDADGALVVDITGASPAEKAGLKKGDVITKVNGKAIHNPDDLYKAIHEYKPGDKVKVACQRDGKEQTVSAVLEKSKNGYPRVYQYNYRMPENYNMEQDFGQIMMDDQPKLGLKAQDAEEGKGVDVMDVVAGSAADKAGLKKGDNIVRFDGHDVNGADELAEKLSDARSKGKVSISILRDGKSQDLELHIPRKLKSAEL